MIFFSADNITDIKTISGPLKELTGYSDTDFLNNKDLWISRIHPADKERVIQTFADINLSKNTSIEYRWQNKAGHYRWFEDLLLLTDKPDSTEPRIRGCRNDITERKRAADAMSMLAKTGSYTNIKDFFSLCVEHLAAVYEARFAFIGLLKDDDISRVQMQVLWVNGELVEPIEYELAGTPCADILNHSKTLIPRDVAKLYADDHMLVEMGAESYFGTPLIDSNGSTIGLVSVINTLPMALSPWTHSILGSIAQRIAPEIEKHHAQHELEKINKDLEERVRLRTEELENARDAAEAGSLAKSVFLTNMSHELRTPLNAILGMSQLLIQSGIDPDRSTECLFTIQQAGNDLLKLIEDILNLSRIESGQFSLEPTTFNANDLVTGTINQLTVQAEKNGNILEFTPINTIPDTLVADAARIRQILANLIQNAIKFTSNGNITVELSEEPLDEPRDSQSIKLCFSVKDTGVGIAANMIDSIFERFTQADSSSTRNHGGAGLGLSIAQKLAQAMGGSIGVRSKLEQGSNFWFCIPCGIATDTSTTFIASNNTSPASPESTVSKHQHHILVVEDNPLNQITLKNILLELGYQVDIAGSGHEAINRYDHQSHDLILMDISMPDMDGYEATRRIRQQYATEKQTPIIAVTAHATTNDKQHTLDAGMNDYMSKPFSIQQLQQTLEKWLS